MSGYTMGEYTQEQYDELYEMVDRDYKADYESSEVIRRINDPGFFRSFSERMLAFYNEVTGSCFTEAEATKDLQQRLKCKGIPIDPRTIKSWFSGEREPKYGDNDRERLFAVAFALELDTRQTERLFHKVFLDKAFNKRNHREFIYLYCIKNKLPLSTAENLIAHVNSSDNIVDIDELTEKTKLLADALDRDMNEGELLTFILTHPRNFSLNNTAAKQRRQELLGDLTGTEEKPGYAFQEYKKRGRELAINRIEYDEKHKTMSSYGRNIFKPEGKDLLKPENRTPTSTDFLLDMIMNPAFTEKGDNDTQSIRNIFQKKEIYIQFPDKNALSNTAKDPSSYALRKDIILLYFYWHWVQDYLKDQSAYGSDGFIDGLNHELFECGFSPLYLGNPYDWLFLYCSTCAVDRYSPLDKFRLILSPDIYYDE